MIWICLEESTRCFWNLYQLDSEMWSNLFIAAGVIMNGWETIPPCISSSYSERHIRQKPYVRLIYFLRFSSLELLPILLRSDVLNNAKLLLSQKVYLLGEGHRKWCFLANEHNSSGAKSASSYRSSRNWPSRPLESLSPSRRHHIARVNAQLRIASSIECGNLHPRRNKWGQVEERIQVFILVDQWMFGTPNSCGCLFDW